LLLLLNDLAFQYSDISSNLWDGAADHDDINTSHNSHRGESFLPCFA
jgi:hypothetical protein